jgi:transposase InsO family protein
VATMCRVLEVSTSGYYAWRKREPSSRSMSDAALLARIREIHTRSRGTYGVPRIHAELEAEGIRVSRKRAGRLMREAGLKGAHRRRAPLRANIIETLRPLKLVLRAEEDH